MHPTEKMKECVSIDVEKAFENMICQSKKKTFRKLRIE